MQVSEAGDQTCVRLLCAYLSHEASEVLGMSIWALGQIANTKLCSLEPVLGSQLRRKLVDVATSADTMSLKKIAEWAISQVWHEVCDGSAQDKTIALAQASCQDETSFSTGMLHAKDFLKVNPKLKSLYLALIQQTQSKLLRVAQDSILHTIEWLNKRDLATGSDAGGYTFLCNCLADTRPTISLAAYKALGVNCVPGNKKLCNTLMMMISVHDSEDTACTYMLLLGKAAVPGDAIISSFLTKKLIGMIFKAKYSSPSCHTSQNVKESKYIATALNVLTELEETGSSRLRNISLLCHGINSRLVSAAAQMATDKAVFLNQVDAQMERFKHPIPTHFSRNLLLLPKPSEETKVSIRKHDLFKNCKEKCISSSNIKDTTTKELEERSSSILVSSLEEKSKLFGNLGNESLKRKKSKVFKSF